MATASISSAAGNIAASVDSALESYSQPLFFWTIGLIYVSYFFLVMGVTNLAPDMLYYLDMFMHFFICMFLIVRFNPMRKLVCNATDQRIVFAAAIILISTQAITQTAIYFTNHLKDVFESLFIYT